MAEQPEDLFKTEADPPSTSSQELLGLRARLTAKQETPAVRRPLPVPVLAALAVMLAAAVIGVVTWARTPGPPPQAAPAATDVAAPQSPSDPAATATSDKASVPQGLSVAPSGVTSKAKRPAKPRALPLSDVLPALPAVALPVVRNYAAVLADRRGVNAAIERYRDGAARLDAAAVRAVWPSANAQDLAREFGQLQEQQVEFHSCDLDIKETTAAASCTGVAGSAQKIGSTSLRFNDRRWLFTLKRAGDAWLIQDVVIR
ncbi:MAG TPA: hypothetical protein VFV98_06310 [Vicinamibacterales bacterium]|nr:hypothetical protein [Vicinamibacterales bacterium]